MNTQSERVFLFWLGGGALGGLVCTGGGIKENFCMLMLVILIQLYQNICCFKLVKIECFFSGSDESCVCP